MVGSAEGGLRARPMAPAAMANKEGLCSAAPQGGCVALLGRWARRMQLCRRASHPVTAPPPSPAGSGTYAMEAVARQFATGKQVLVLRNGYFSYRWTQIFDQCNIPTEHTVLKAKAVDLLKVIYMQI